MAVFVQLSTGKLTFKLFQCFRVTVRRSKRTLRQRPLCGRPAIGRVRSEGHIAKAARKDWTTKLGLEIFVVSKKEFVMAEVELQELIRSGNELAVGDKLRNTHWSSLSRQAQVRPSALSLGLSACQYFCRGRSMNTAARNSLW